MAKLAACILLIMANFTASVAGAHVGDVCREFVACMDLEETAGSSSQVTAADAQKNSTSLPTGSVPHECPCQSHHHNCSHQFHGIRNQVNVELLLGSESAYPNEVSVRPLSPFIDGPFQPPKA